MNTEELEIRNREKHKTIEACFAVGLPLVPYHGVENNLCTCKKIDCASIGKHPIKKNLPESRFKTIEQAQDFVHHNPFYNLGISLSENTSLIVFDCDKRNGGLESREKLESTAGLKLPATPTVDTGGGGTHEFYVADPEKLNLIRGTSKEFPGIDFKQNGFVVAAGSLHKSGKMYQWREGMSPSDLPFATLPDEFINRLVKKSETESQDKPRDIAIPEGERNNRLCSIAYSLLFHGVPSTSLEDELLKINSERCTPPEDENKVKEIAKSAIASFQPSSARYFFLGGKTFYSKDGTEESAFPIAEGQAYVSGQKIFSDGQNQELRYEITVLHPKIHIGDNRFLVRPEELDSNTWIIRFGAEFIISPGMQSKQQLPIAMRKLGTPDFREVIYTATGFHIIKGTPYYLSSAGAIGSDGLNEEITVDLSEGSVEDFKVSLPRSQEDLQNCLSYPLDLLKIAEPHIAYTALASVFRAALNDFRKSNITMVIFGTTGSMKSCLAAVMQGFWGPSHSYDNLPSSFTSTPNAVEKLFHSLKDCLVVRDDFVPGENNPFEATRSIRSVGNGSARGRMNADTTLRKSYPSRSFVVITAESMFRGPSIIARCVALELEKDSINTDVLSSLQRQVLDEVPSRFYGAYVQWIAGNYDRMKDLVPRLFNELVSLINVQDAHKKTASNIAQVLLGLKCFLLFCEEKNLMSASECDHHWYIGSNAIMSLCSSQASLQNEDDPATVFIDTLKLGFKKGRFHLCPTESHVSINEQFGWKPSRYSSEPLGQKIGYFHRGEILLDPDIAFEEVTALSQATSRKIILQKNAILRRLAEKGYIKKDGEGRNTIQRTIDPNKLKERFLVLNCWERWFNNNSTPPAPETPQTPSKNGVSVEAIRTFLRTNQNFGESDEATRVH